MKSEDERILKLRKQIWAIEDENFKKEVLPKNKALVGKYFKYVGNCYSSPKKKSDYWDVYYRVVMVSSDGRHLYAVGFEITSDKEFRLKAKEFFSVSDKIEITKKQYDSARKRFEKQFLIVLNP